MSAATETVNRAEDATAPCANCGHPRNSRFCPKCGQNDRDYIRSLPPLLGDILKETFELDSRIRRTVRPLFLRPGELASEFSRNRRASYMSPVRLYLVTSILFFFLLSVFAPSEFRPQRVEREEAAERATELEDARAAADIDALKSVLPHPQRRKVDAILKRGGSLAKMAVYGLAKDPEAYAERGTWQNYMAARVIDALEDPAAVLSQFVENLPFAMFVTLPAYTLLLMFFFFGSHRFFTEHLVFAVQLHTFAFIVLAVSMLLPDGEPERWPDRAERPVAASEEGSPLPTIDVRIDGEGERAQRVVEALVDVSLEAEDTQEEGATDAPELDGIAKTEDAADAPDGVVVALGPTDDQTDIFDLIGLFLFLWLLAYHYLALRRFYRNGRLRTTIKWAALTFAYAILLIPGMALSALLTVFQLR